MMNEIFAEQQGMINSAPPSPRIIEFEISFIPSKYIK